MRPQTQTDEAIFISISAVLLKQGYEALTLQNIAQQAQLSPAALSKRFGSKKAMLLAYYDFLIQVTEASFAELSKRPLPLLEAFTDLFTEWNQFIKEPSEYANLLMLYLNFYIDPQLVHKSRQRLRLVDDEVQKMLRAAVQRGELICEDIPGMSQTLQAAASGAALLWCKDEPGSDPKERIAASLRIILENREAS
ncbi:MAG: TetR/AcrR family transcriptional regulator [Anaerolineales bacterium]|nr:TetR/AcrR family transcriptional regulator [Anaerolineales bacterium]